MATRFGKTTGFFRITWFERSTRGRVRPRRLYDYVLDFGEDNDVMT